MAETGSMTGWWIPGIAGAERLVISRRLILALLMRDRLRVHDVGGGLSLFWIEAERLEVLLSRRIAQPLGAEASGAGRLARRPCAMPWCARLFACSGRTSVREAAVGQRDLPGLSGSWLCSATANVQHFSNQREWNSLLGDGKVMARCSASARLDKQSLSLR
jgi:hypothetical protein